MNRFLGMPPQVTRLALTTLVIVALFLVARSLLVPPSFGQYGHYRGEALREIAAREPYWAGRGACDDCHADHVKKVAGAEHKGLSCEDCHGPSRAHVENPEVKLPKMAFGQCVRCHEASPSRAAWLHQINSHNHYTGQGCTECHAPHQPNEVP